MTAEQDGLDPEEDRRCYRCGREVEADSDAGRCHDCTVTLLRAALKAAMEDVDRLPALALDLQGKVADAWNEGWDAGVTYEHAFSEFAEPDEPDNPYRAALADQPEQG